MKLIQKMIATDITENVTLKDEIDMCGMVYALFSIVLKILKRPIIDNYVTLMSMLSKLI